ncbi:MAG: GNAT family N-acetyltransferase [Alphaproteobacteria bacterium]|jgi:RimJ/RimL family protein N-acetyltransferase
MDITLRRLMPDEWPLLRDIRLRALAADPHVFGASFAQEKENTDAVWRERLESPDVAVFGVFDAAGDIAGMTGIAVAREDPGKTIAKMWGSWLRPDLRGRGLSVPIYQARIDWARAHPTIARIIVSHRASNAASMHANQKHGFVRTHAESHVWHDGVEEAHIFYELRIK